MKGVQHMVHTKIRGLQTGWRKDVFPPEQWDVLKGLMEIVEKLREEIDKVKKEIESRGGSL